MYEEIFLNQLNNTSIGDTDTVPKVYGVSTEIDGIETTPNEVYGVGTDSIETTPNEVYEVGRADGIETIPNEVYGISTDGIVTTPNVVYDKMWFLVSSSYA